MQIHSDSNQGKLNGEKSIVVLPFRNISSDPENEYFSDGITEEIINALTKVDGVGVIARTSAFSFKGKDIDLRDVGIQLNVAYVLEGSVRKAGNKVRVTAQLIKASDGFHVFSEVYHRELKDIFEVQDDISNKIVQKFTDKIGNQIQDKNISSSSTNNLDAYELYLKGRYNLNKGSLEAVNTAIQYFETALKKDKDFALPAAGLAACYTFLGGSGHMSSIHAFKKANEFAQKANLLDENVADTHLALATNSFWCEWDFESTENSIRKAIQLSPGTSGIHRFNALFLMTTGKLDNALIEAKLATKLDPLSLKSKFQLGELFYRTERYIEAIEVFDQILAENHQYKQAHILKGWCHLFLGEIDLAINLFRDIPITNDQSISFYGGLAIAYQKQKQFDRVLECMQNFKTDVSQGYTHWINYNYTLIYRALDETDRMFEYLEKSLLEKITPLIFIQVDPVWREYRKDQKFKDLVDRTFIHSKKDKNITINSDTSENLDINLRQLVFIEAQENYSRIVWLEGDKPCEKILRITLKNIEDQIVDSRIIRCHRSYIINSNFQFTILGNSNGYHLSSKYFKETIPISRSKGKDIVSKLRES